jgi:hypothetical protein
VLNILTGLLAIVPTATTANLCTHSRPSPTRAEMIRESKAIFIGVVLDMMPVWPPRQISPNQMVTFLVEQRWKGPVSDTIRVEVFEPCGPVISVGRTYLIFARNEGEGYYIPQNFGHSPDIASPHAIVRAHYQATRRMLGQPKWIAPPIGKRPYDRIATPTQQAQRARIGFMVSDGQVEKPSMTIELMGTGLKQTTGSTGSAYFEDMPIGPLYRARVRMPDGRYEDHYVRPRCSRLYNEACWHGSILWLGSSLKGWQRP